jgi:farnesyl diphosphate synthase
MVKALESVLENISLLLYEKMDNLLPEARNTKQDRLIEAMRYSALAPGKRLRPFLTVTTANLFGVSKESALQTAAAIEFIHTYSLVHDDLPAMDDDDLRRGQPSCHIKFDEGTAILVGDGLLTLAFEILSDVSTHGSNTVRCELVRCIAKAAGPSGMVGGQMMDLVSDNKKMSINEIIHLQRLKTGELFAVSCESGAILGNAAAHLRNLLRAYAHDIGLAFQITDDLLDAESAGNDNSDRMDKSAGKPTFVSAMGKTKAREQARILSDQAIGYLQVFGKKADLLRDLARYIIERKS